MANITVVVKVLPARLDWLEALAQGDEVFSAPFAIPVVTDWIGFREARSSASVGFNRASRWRG